MRLFPKYVVCVSSVCSILAYPFANAMDLNIPKWPEVTPLHAVYSLSKSSAHVETVVFAKDGTRAYKLSCHPATFESEAEGDFNGLFQCKLFPANINEAATDVFYPATDWNHSYTRASFLRGQIAGACKTHKYFGNNRMFHLRGMKIRLGITDFHEKTSIEKLLRSEREPNYSYVLRIDIDIDPSAVRKHAEAVRERCDSDWEFDKFGKVVELKEIVIDESWELEHSKQER